MPCVVSRSSLTWAGSIGLVKLGQPHPDSNLSDEANNGSPETTSTYMPCCLLLIYSPLPGNSVPFCCVTRYCSGESLAIAAGFLSYVGIFFLLTRKTRGPAAYLRCRSR